MTYTVATMEVSPSTYAEIKKKLEDAGYHHAIDDDGTIDMTGIGIVAGETEELHDA